MKVVSKSSYTQYLKCPKMLWYNCYGYSKEVSAQTPRTLDDGTAFGIKAQQYFGECKVVERESADGRSMTRQTEDYLAEGAMNIAEATFVAKNGYCQVDILHRNEAGNFDLVEVKSSSQIKSYYYDDLAFQYYVVRECVPVDRCFLLHMNSDYIRDGELTNELFSLEDVTEKVRAKLHPKVKARKKKGEPEEDSNRDLIGEAISSILEIANGELPDIRVHSQCDEQWECPFMNDCIACLSEAEQTMMRTEALTWKQRIKCVDAGEMVYPKGKEVLKMADDEVIIDAERIGEFLQTIRYPLYLLDFETIQNIVPQYNGQHPWQQTPFQYSLHIMNDASDSETDLIHREFLWTNEDDPRRALAEQLLKDIPRDACVMAYNMAFERTIIAELAERFPDLSERLKGIRECCIDLMVPFKSRAYYKGDMKGSYSIKKVLPGCYPDDPALDYHNLEDVQNGSMAQEKYLELIRMPEGAEKEQLRINMLKYCELDTFAMFKLVKFLYGISMPN